MDLIESLQHKCDKETAEQQNGADAVLVQDVGEETPGLANANGDMNLAKEKLVVEGMPSAANPPVPSKRKRTAVLGTVGKRTRKSEHVNDDAGHKMLSGKISDATDKNPVNENKESVLKKTRETRTSNEAAAESPSNHPNAQADDDALQGAVMFGK